jgi:hypothetical protein
MDSDDDEDTSPTLPLESSVAMTVPPSYDVIDLTSDEDSILISQGDLPPEVMTFVARNKDKLSSDEPKALVVYDLCDSDNPDAEIDGTDEDLSADDDTMDVSFGYVSPLGLSHERSPSTGGRTVAEDEEEAEMAEVEGLLNWLEDLGPGIDKVERKLSDIAAPD